MISSHTITGGFSLGECDHLRMLALSNPTADAGLVGRNRDHNLRRADLVWLDDVPGAEWVMDRIIALAREANRLFGFDIAAFHESPQIARYDAARQGHFDWHADIGDGPVARQRKLTMVAQLSDPDDYAGGLLELMPSAQVITADRGCGAVTFFPSYVLHRVTPVTEGVRQSLTIWAHGPAFR